MRKKRHFIRSFIIMAAVFFLMGSYQNRLYAESTDHSVDSETVDDEFNEEDFGESEGEDGFGDDGHNGFDEPDIEIKLDISKLKETGSQEDSSLSFGGFVKEEVGYSYSYNDSNSSPYDKPVFSKIRTTLNLYLDYKFLTDWKTKLVGNGYYDYAYEQRGRDKFTDEVLESMESEAEVRDFFVEGPIADWLRIKAGRQVIAWGESDTAQITDMANPRDMREIGMVDLEDARIPVLATKLAVLFGSLEVDLVAIHEFRANKTGARGSEFDFLADLPAVLATLGGTLNEEETTGYNDSEFLIRFYKTFNGGDISLVWADTYDDFFFLDSSPGSASLTPRHKRIQSIGATGNKVLGSWLFKTEVGQKSGKALALKSELMGQKLGSGIYKTSFDSDDEVWVEKNILEGMIGADYSGFSDLTITAEVTGEQIQDYEDTLEDNEISGGYSLRIAHSALNDTMKSTLFWIRYSDDNGDVVRADVQYDAVEALTLTIGVIDYLASKTDATVYPIKDNDRLILSAKYSF